MRWKLFIAGGSRSPAMWAAPPQPQSSPMPSSPPCLLLQSRPEPSNRSFFKPMSRNVFFVAAHIALITIFFFSGCTRNSSEAPQSPPAGYAVRTVPIDASSTGAIRGNVKFTGAAPPRAEVDMTMDPACGFANKGPQLAESVIVNQGELQNVFVYVKDGLGNYIIPKASQPV